jgi:hypothetical protein
MSWKNSKEKERFFEQLDKAFNTPSTESLVLPKYDDDDVLPTPKEGKTRRASAPTSTTLAKRRRASSGDRVCSTGVGIRPPEQPRPVKRRTSVNTKVTRSTIKSEEKKSTLLDGMVLFFIPNSKKNGVRKFRMTLFAQHGADVRDVWSDEVSHVICDHNVTGERVLRDLCLEQLPVQLP